MPAPRDDGEVASEIRSMPDRYFRDRFGNLVLPPAATVDYPHASVGWILKGSTNRKTTLGPETAQALRERGFERYLRESLNSPRRWCLDSETPKRNRNDRAWRESSQVSVAAYAAMPVQSPARMQAVQTAGPVGRTVAPAQDYPAVNPVPAYAAYVNPAAVSRVQAGTSHFSLYGYTSGGRPASSTPAEGSPSSQHQYPYQQPPAQDRGRGRGR